jgi:guanylate kinase
MPLGELFILSAPSGAGKTTLIQSLVAGGFADLGGLAFSVSHSTRKPRQGEIDGRDYHFVDRAAFEAMVQADAFLEWAEVYGNHYGSPRAPIMEALDRGESVLFDIDFQGAMKVHKQAGEDSVLVYILPPSLAEMSRRLHARSQDSEEVIHRRLARAKDEVAAWEQFDYVILNDDFDKAYSDLAHIYHAERQKRARNPWIGNLVGDLLKEET